jgi:hypothetical protein
MTAHRTDEKYVTPRGEIGGDKSENVKRDAIDRDERVPPLADRRQRGRGVMVKLRNHIQSEAVPR